MSAPASPDQPEVHHPVILQGPALQREEGHAAPGGEDGADEARQVEAIRVEREEPWPLALEQVRATAAAQRWDDDLLRTVVALFEQTGALDDERIKLQVGVFLVCHGKSLMRSSTFLQPKGGAR